MKKFLLLLSLLTTTTIMINAQSADAHNGQSLRHVVLFSFKDGTTADEIKKVETAFRELPSKIEQIKGFEWGINNSPENLNQGFTHCFFLTFDSEAGRAAYLPHPAHRAFGGVLKPYLDKVLVIDYWVRP